MTYLAGLYRATRGLEKLAPRRGGHNDAITILDARLHAVNPNFGLE